MPPKTKKGDKNKKKQRIAIDDIDTTILSRTKLEEFCAKVNLELNEEIEAGAFLRLERDKLVNMIEISKEQLKIWRGKIRDAEIEIMKAEDGHRIDMGLNRQKIIHIRNEMEDACSDKKMYTNTIINNERNIHKNMTADMIIDINHLNECKYKIEKNFNKNKLKLEKQKAEKISIIRDKDRKSNILAEIGRDKVIKDLTAQLQIIFYSNYKALCYVKDNDYRMFLDINTQRTKYLKHYYNRIINQNQDIIQLKKNKINTMRDSMSKLDKRRLEEKELNLKLVEELQILEKEKRILKEKLSSAEQLKNELKEVKQKFKKRRQLLGNLEIENFVQYMINEKKDAMQRENEKLDLTTFLKSLSKSQGIILIIESLILNVYSKLKEIDSNLGEIKTKLYKKGGKLNTLLESVHENQDTSLDEINYAIEEISETRNNLFRKYRQILKRFNIQFENTGFDPLPLGEIMAQIDNTHIIVDEKFMLTNPILIEHLFNM